MISSIYSERDLQLVWERQAFRRENLLTEDARRVVVEFPGVRAGEGGPDFTGARIVLGGVRRSGDVELHLVPSGWRAHGHHRDGAYAGVILHVVLRRDPFVEPPRVPPVLVLEPYLGVVPGREAGPWGSVHFPVSGSDDLDVLGEAWFAERRARLERALERAPADEVLYREILVALGYKLNKAPMAEVARRCPLHSLRGGAPEIHARLRAAAEDLPRPMWRLRRGRPANHPWRRLEGMARFVAAAAHEGLARGLRSRRSLGEMTAWLDPDGTGTIGARRAREVALNVFVPYLGREVWNSVAGQEPPPLPGAALRRAGGEVTTVRRYFGALRRLKR